jgi:hypothetical protein
VARTSKKRKAAQGPGEDLRPRLSAHPRARRQIREAKAWAGIVAFVLTALLSLQANLPLFDAGCARSSPASSATSSAGPSPSPSGGTWRAPR